MITVLPKDDPITIPIDINEYKALLSAATRIDVIKALVLDDSSNYVSDLKRKIMAVIRSGEVMYAVDIKEDSN